MAGHIVFRVCKRKAREQAICNFLNIAGYNPVIPQKVTRKYECYPLIGNASRNCESVAIMRRMFINDEILTKENLTGRPPCLGRGAGTPPWSIPMISKCSALIRLLQELYFFKISRLVPEKMNTVLWAGSGPLFSFQPTNREFPATGRR